MTALMGSAEMIVMMKDKKSLDQDIVALMESIIEAAQSISKLVDKVENLKLREKLRQGRDQAILSRHLITLKQDIPVPEHPDAYRLLAPDHDALRRLYAFLGFTRLIKSELPVANLSTAGFKLVSGAEELAGLVKEFSRAECLTVDLETTSLDPVKADIVGISLCIDADRAYYLPVGHREEDGTLVPGQLEKDTVVFFLRPLLADPKLPKLGHNLKYDYSVLLTHGIFMAGPLFDTMVASYLLNPARSSHKLDDLGKEILERRLTSFTEVTGASSRDDAFTHVQLLAAKDYSCEDVRATFLLWEIFAPELKAKGLWDLFVRVEMPLVPILAEMEHTGIRVDPRLLADMSKEFAQGLETLEKEIHTLAGQVFNINSPRQLGAILFERLGLPHGRKTKTGYSTDLEVLEKLANFHELPAAVLSFRNLSKLKSTYVDSLASLIHPVTGRIHSSFNQTVTATGRLSSSRPNLQNIPVRTREGQRIREAFIPADGYSFLGGDYSQIELRVLAHYSQDKEFVAAFHQGEDIHAKTAQEIFRTLPGMVTPEMRRVAKTINFGIIYGMSAFGLASQLNISRKEAQVFIDRYFELYRGVREFMDAIIKKARKDRLVTTLLGRRRLLPDIESPNKNVREFAERTAINTPIQGTAADIIKLAMQQSHAVLKAKGLRARMILQIHDELVFEVPDEELAETSPLVQQAMEGVMQLNVPLVVNISAGKNLAAI